MNHALAVLCFGLLAAPLGAQDPEVTEDSCCSEAAPSALEPLPADATAKERRLWAIHDEAAADPKNAFLCRRHVDDFRARLAACPADATLETRFGLRYSLALFLVQLGELDEAIRLNQECLDIAAENPDVTKAWVPEILFRLAAAHFRLAEKANCIARHTAESCIFPLAGSAVHLDRSGAVAAAAVLDRLLTTEGSDLDLEARWLLNIAHMALGDWPEGVPERWRILEDRFASEADAPRFVDRAREIGLAHHNHAGSIVIDDFTGDGRLDVFTCSFDTARSVTLCRNEGDGTFADVTEASGLARQLGGINAIQLDADGDGALDLFVVRGGGFFAAAKMPCSLLRQDRPGHFTDATAEAGIEIEAPSQTACCADIDLDGDVDLFVGYETEATGNAANSTITFPSRLWKNDGTGRFTDVAREMGIDDRARCMGATFGDVEQDGDPDLFLTHWLAPNRLYRNDGKRFADVAPAAGVALPESSAPATFLDADADGDLDLFVGYFHHYRPIRTVAAWYIEGRIETDTPRLFENRGDGVFVDATERRGLRRGCSITGLNHGDVDADGLTDLYLATGAHDLAALFPNLLLLNGEKFRDATFAAGVGHLQKGNGVAFGDLDDDGDLDLGLQVGGFQPDDAFGNVLFENPGFGGHWLAIDVRGTKCDRFAIGARVRAHVKGSGGERDVYQFVGSGGSRGSNPLRVFLGLGDATAVVFVEVRWPGARGTQRVESVPIDAALRIVEGNEGFERLERKAFRLGK